MSDQERKNTTGRVASSRSPQKGGVKGGHAAVSSYFETSYVRRPAHATSSNNNRSNNNTASYSNHNTTTSSSNSSPGSWPKGLTNVGNTCYANATLQCLMSTALTNALIDPQVVPLFRRYSSNPNLLAQGSGSVDSAEDEIDPTSTTTTTNNPNSQASAEKIREEEKRRERKQRELEQMEENCEWLTQELTSITQEYTRESEATGGSSSAVMGWLSSAPQNDVVNPGSITKHPDRLSKCLNPYQQEDAHEFLRALLSTLVMNGHNKKLSSLFDGLLESAVTCQDCGRPSLTRDRYMDLSLDINQPNIANLDDALYEYTKTETLDEDNAVFCQKCKKKQRVTKGLRLATAPSILVCHLKRFAFDRYGRLIRLHKKIKFPARLEIGDFMSTLNKARPPPYDLVGVLVHQGHTCASGHYLAFVKKNNEWFKCNDSVVTQVDEATVFDQQAYILMYEVADMRKKTGCTPITKDHTPSEFEDEFEPVMPKDAHSTDACASWESSDHDRWENQTRTNYRRILSMLNDPDGLARMFTDMCCASEISEPKTHELKRRTSRSSREDNQQDEPMLRRTFSNDGVKVIEVPQKKRNRKVRSQTAPRQRPQDDNFLNMTGFNMSAPRTTSSTRSTGKTRLRGSGGDKVRGWFSKSSERDRRGKSRTASRARSIHEVAGAGDLPPLPRHGRAKSNTSIRRSVR